MSTGASTSALALWASKESPLPAQHCKRVPTRPKRHTLLKPLNSPRLIFIAVVLASALSACQPASSGTTTTAPPQQGDATVTRVVDGDTIQVNFRGAEETVRLIGIDTPETVDPKRPVGCYGKEASDFTKSQLPKSTSVRLVLDAEPRDKYGRLLAYVYRAQDNVFINDQLARLGYANVLTIPPNVAHADEFVAAVREAREQQRGLWKSCPDPT